MDRDDPPVPAEEPGSEDIHVIVPARAVLTELARGFLLVHESNPERAVRFAETFLREQSGRARPPAPSSGPPLSRARLALGRYPRGAVEPSAGSPSSP